MGILDSVSSFLMGSSVEDEEELKKKAYSRGIDCSANCDITDERLGIILKDIGLPYLSNEKLRDEVKNEFRRGHNESKAAYLKEYKASLEAHGVSCGRCRGVAYPVEGTERNYKCNCGNRFTGARHPF